MCFGIILSRDIYNFHKKNHSLPKKSPKCVKVCRLTDTALLEAKFGKCPDEEEAFCSVPLQPGKPNPFISNPVEWKFVSTAEDKENEERADIRVRIRI